MALGDLADQQDQCQPQGQCLHVYSATDADMSHELTRCDVTFSYSLKHRHTLGFFFFLKEGSIIFNVSDVSDRYYSGHSQKSNDLMASGVFLHC